MLRREVKRMVEVSALLSVLNIREIYKFRIRILTDDLN